MFCTAGLIIGNTYYDNREKTKTAYIEKSAEVTAVLHDCLYSGTAYSAYNAEITAFDKKACSISCVLYFGFDVHPKPYTVISVFGSFGEINESSLSYYESNGMYLRFNAASENAGSYRVIGKSNSIMRWFYNLRESVSEILGERLSPGALSFARAIFLGDRSALPEDVKKDFSAVGLSHMLALSGMHLSILAGTFVFVLSRVGVSVKKRYFLGIFVCVFYILLTGASFSVLRAGIMFIVFSMCNLVGRDSDSITALFCSFALICTFAPYAIFNAGLLLSFTSTLGIVIIMPFFNRLASRPKNILVKILFSAVIIPFSVSLSALAFSVPIFFIYFDYISLLTVISNILISYPLSLLLLSYPVLLLFSFIFPAACVYIGAECNFITELIMAYCHKFGQTDGVLVSLKYPFVKFIVIGTVLLSAIFFIINFRHTAVYILILALGISSYGISYVAFNRILSEKSFIGCVCGKRNDGIIILSNGKTMICDMTYGDNGSVDMLFEKNENISYVRKADRYLITHYHKKDISRISKFIREGRIGGLFLVLPKDTSETEMYFDLLGVCLSEGVSFSVLNSENEIRFGDFTVSVAMLAPKRENYHPVCEIKITKGEFDFLYLGSGYAKCNGGFSHFAYYDALFFGGHGINYTKAERVNFSYDSAVCSYSVYPYLISSDFEKLISGYDMYTFYVK
ncbi:MAG: ComEC/Rec2 family competence protein [Clostridia bacterium]|nr:ComEC/Rec2 family competence protein [Clostridia bacterium]